MINVPEFGSLTPKRRVTSLPTPEDSRTSSTSHPARLKSPLPALPITAMVMSQGTYTFLACFAGFWLVWAVIVMLCCFCSFLQRRLKRRHEERLREQCLRTVEMEPLSCHPAGYPTLPPPPPPPPPPPQLPREPPQFCPPQTLSPTIPLQVPHPMPEANWVSMPGKLKGLLLFGYLFSCSARHSGDFLSSRGHNIRRDSVLLISTLLMLILILVCFHSVV